MRIRPDDGAPVLIAGFGSIGRRHFRNLRALGHSQFVFLRSGRGVIDDAEIAGYPSETILEDALAHSPSIAIVAGPTSTHTEIAIAAAASGCDLYIEKPLGHRLADVERLAGLVASNRLVTMIGCQFRFHPLLLDIDRVLKQGEIGKIVGASATWGEYLPAWHPWEDHRQSYSARPELGGGAFLTLIHPIDYLMMLFGRCQVRRAISARVPSLETPAGEDWGDILLAFENGVEGHVHLDYVQQPPVHMLRVVGDRGRLECDFLAGKLHISSGSDHRIVGVPEGFERNTMFLDAMTHFLDCVDRRSITRCTLADGVHALEVVMDARTKAAEGPKIAFSV